MPFVNSYLAKNLMSSHQNGVFSMEAHCSRLAKPPDEANSEQQVTQRGKLGSLAMLKIRPDLDDQVMKWESGRGIRERRGETRRFKEVVKTPS